MHSQTIASPRLRVQLGYAVLLIALVSTFFLSPARAAEPPTGKDTILQAADATKILPTSVFYRGQTAPVQGRNSGGVKYTDGMMVLVTNVDNSAYSSGIQQKFQEYLLTEVSLEIDGKHLPPGAYGLGFVGDEFVVTDIGAHDLFQTKSKTDADMKRPTPLQVLADSAADHYRIYSGRTYVVFTRRDK